MRKYTPMKIILLIAMTLFWSYQFYDHIQIKRIENYLNAFSKSDHCKVTMVNGERVLIDGDHWLDIKEKGVHFTIFDKGKNTYKDQQLDDLMTLDLYQGERHLTTIFIKELKSSEEKIKKLNDLARENEENPLRPYYDEIGDRKIVTIGDGVYSLGMYTFLGNLFEELEVFIDEIE